MRFFLDINPPTATAQEKAVCVIGGRPIFYDPAPLKKAKAMLMEHLGKHRPAEPLAGAVELRTTWLFPVVKKHKSGEWRTSRPDTDNLQKMLSLRSDCPFRRHILTLLFYHASIITQGNFVRIVISTPRVRSTYMASAPAGPTPPEALFDDIILSYFSMDFVREITHFIPEAVSAHISMI